MTQKPTNLGFFVISFGYVAKDFDSNISNTNPEALDTQHGDPTHIGRSNHRPPQGVSNALESLEFRRPSGPAVC